MAQLGPDLLVPLAVEQAGGEDAADGVASASPEHSVFTGRIGGYRKLAGAALFE